MVLLQPGHPEHWFYKEWIYKAEERRALYLHSPWRITGADASGAGARNFSGALPAAVCVGGGWPPRGGYTISSTSWARPSRWAAWAVVHLLRLRGQPHVPGAVGLRDSVVPGGGVLL